MKTGSIKKIGNMIRISEEDLRDNKRFAEMEERLRSEIANQFARQLQRKEVEILLHPAFAQKVNR